MVWLALGVLALGCGGPPRAEVEGRKFVRCAQRDPPRVASELVGLSLTLEQRVLTVRAPAPPRVVAFAGPAGERIPEVQLARLRAARPSVIVYLGGLGDEAATARHNLTRLASLDALTLFLPGGSDRAPIVGEAFDALDDAARDRVLDASGLRGLVIDEVRYAVVAGAPLGRLARTDDACGFTEEDLAEVRAALAGSRAPVRLLSWHAPAGQGVSMGLGASELGSPELGQLAHAIGARGGIHAYPEARAGRAASAEGALVVRRLGLTGARRADGSFAAAGFSVLPTSTGGRPDQP
ncbi:MAG: hypothetical protein ABW252_02475 [Polyangiales bacterium]